MILDQTRERFLTAIAKEVDPERIAEIHFFAPIRQGGIESGVAVIAAADAGDRVDAEQGAGEESTTEVASGERGPSEAAPPQDDGGNERHVIYTARYRLTLKGPDRGKWETAITAEADAPIVAVDAVVRGVQRRAGDIDDPTRMSGDEIRSALPASS
jgi:hypothetical protein